MNYLYNGVPFPNLPNASYSHAVITYDSEYPDYAELYFSNNPTFVKLVEPIYPSGATPEPWLVAPNQTQVEKYSLENGKWVYNGSAFIDTEWSAIGALNPWWSNYDIKNEENEVVLYASDPVPVSVTQRNPSAMLLGFQVGQAIRRMRGKEKIPVGFFYGHVAKEGETPTHTIDGVDYVGFDLPRTLPKWDKEAYPYAVIVNYVKYALLFALSGYHIGTSRLDEWAVNAVGANCIRWQASIEYKIAWNNEYVASGNGWVCPDVASIIWANFDIHNEDGTLYLAACDIIPIYE